MILTVDTLVNVLEINQTIRDIGENKNTGDSYDVFTNENPNDFITTLDLANLLDDFDQYSLNFYPDSSISLFNWFE